MKVTVAVGRSWPWPLSVCTRVHESVASHCASLSRPIWKRDVAQPPLAPASCDTKVSAPRQMLAAALPVAAVSGSEKYGYAVTTDAPVALHKKVGR